MPRSKPSIPVWAALVGSGLAGGLVALQSRINGGLSQQIGNGYVAAVLSFGVGLVVVTLATVLTRRGRRGIGLIRREIASGHLPVWALLGGVCGAMFVLGQGLIVTVIGLALFTVSVVAGQVLGGLVIDRIGLGPSGRVNPTWYRLIGTALAVLAVAIAVIGGGADGGSPALAHLWLVLIPFVVGAGIAFQSAVNGLVRSAAQSAVASTFCNFVTGTTVLIVVAAVSIGTEGWPTHWPPEPWYYIGGMIGALFIAAAAMLVRTAGVLLLSMSNVAGQLVVSVAIDAGLPLTGGVTVGMIIGTAVALLAIAIAAIPSRKPLSKA